MGRSRIRRRDRWKMRMPRIFPRRPTQVAVTLRSGVTISGTLRSINTEFITFEVQERSGLVVRNVPLHNVAYFDKRDFLYEDIPPKYGSNIVDPFEPNDWPDPLLVVLNYSGGKQSSCLLWQLLRGDIPRPDPLLVVNADPGMENSLTYDYNRMMAERCYDAGIPFLAVEGPNLYKDLLNLSSSGRSRIDNPPYWTLDEHGSHGRLMQKCTQHYKIAPMDRAIRIYMEKQFGINRDSKRLGNGIVEKWIGFAYDEIDRIKNPGQKYVRFRFPLIEAKMRRDDVVAYFQKNDLPVPPRSVCNACFANGIDTLKDMHTHRPQDWQQAVAVDNAVRDLSVVGVRDTVFVSKTMIPLEELAERGFQLDDKTDQDRWSCDSGYCFT